jgi:gamma-glutamylcyclotransferase (GGCT)/AIG2-like uncharacterized protein YtfP
MNYFFVYGTLKRGEGNHHLIEHAEFVDVGYVRGCVLFDLGGCPAMMTGDFRSLMTDHVAKGEIYAVEDEHLDQTLASLDMLEQEGRMYLRAKLTVRSKEGFPYECTTYLFIPSLQSDNQIVDNGWWSGRDYTKVTEE